VRFASVVQEFGLCNSHKDYFVFFQLYQRKQILLLVYVDDIVIISGNAQRISELN